MNTLSPLQVRPDVGGMLHLIFTSGNPLYATITPAPMMNDPRGRPIHVDLERARRSSPGASLVSYNPADQSSIVTPLVSTVGWYNPSLLEQRLIHAAITRAMTP